MRYIFLLTFFALMACNKALWVHKRDVIYSQDGFIVFYYPDQEAIFFPWKDTLDAIFLRKDHNDGYRIDRNVNGLVYLKELAVNQIVTKNVMQNRQALQLDIRF